MGLTVYHREVTGPVETRYFLGIPHYRKIQTERGVQRYLMGIPLGTKPYRGFRSVPSYLSMEEYSRLKHSEPRKIMLIYTGHLKDYLYFRHFLKEVQASKKYSGYRLIVMLDKGLQEWVENMDVNLVDSFLWVDSNVLSGKSHEVERMRVGLHVEQKMKHYYDTLMFCSPKSSGGELKALAHLFHQVCARQRILFVHEANRQKIEGDLQKQQKLILQMSHVSMGYGNFFRSEYERYRLFFEDVLETPLNHPCEKAWLSKIPHTATTSFIIVDLSADHICNRWHPNNWIQVIKALQVKYPLRVIFFVADEKQRATCERLRHDAGIVQGEELILSKISLMEVIKALHGAVLYMSCENTRVHLAAAMGTDTLVVASGYQYFRYLQDIEKLPNVHVVLPDVRTRSLIQQKLKEHCESENPSEFSVNSVRVAEVLRHGTDLLSRRGDANAAPLGTQATASPQPTLWESSPRRVLIVSVDHIGDYILLRHVFPAIKRSRKYGGSELHFLGSQKVADFAEYLDSDVIDRFFWCSDRPESRSVEQLGLDAKSIHFNGLADYYDTVIFSAANSIQDKKIKALHRLLGGTSYRELVVYAADHIVRKPEWASSCTTEYIGLRRSRMHEFCRITEFFESILEETIPIPFPKIDEKYIPDTTRKKPYIIVAPGASGDNRVWHLRNWADLLLRLRREYGHEIILICSAEETARFTMLQDELRSEGENLEVIAGAGLAEVLALLKHAQLALVADSGIFHISAAVGQKTICLSSGVEYHCFSNYPARSTVSTVFPRGAEEWIQNMSLGDSFWRPPTSLPINALRVDDVFEAAKKFLKK